MNRFEIGCLIVAKKGKAVGTPTERDLLKRLVSQVKSPVKAKVGG